MPCDVAVQNAAAMVVDDEQAVQHADPEGPSLIYRAAYSHG